MNDKNDEAIGWIGVLAVAGAVIFGIYKLIQWIVTVGVPFLITLFGWGGVVIIVAAVILWLLRDRLNWYQWMGSILLIPVVWGILAFIPASGLLAETGLGGNIGLGIIGHAGIGGAFRLLGLLSLGIGSFIVPVVVESKKEAERRESRRIKAEAEAAARKQAEIEAKKAEIITMIDQALNRDYMTKTAGTAYVRPQTLIDDAKNIVMSGYTTVKNIYEAEKAGRKEED